MHSTANQEHVRSVHMFSKKDLSTCFYTVSEYDTACNLGRRSSCFCRFHKCGVQCRWASMRERTIQSRYDSSHPHTHKNKKRILENKEYNPTKYYEGKDQKPIVCHKNSQNLLRADTSRIVAIWSSLVGVIRPVLQSVCQWQFCTACWDYQWPWDERERFLTRERNLRSTCDLQRTSSCSHAWWMNIEKLTRDNANPLGKWRGKCMHHAEFFLLCYIHDASRRCEHVQKRNKKGYVRATCNCATRIFF